MDDIEFELDGWQTVLLCLLFAVFYVGSLYIWSGALGSKRDEPQTIKRRFTSVGIVCVIVPLLLRCFGSQRSSEKSHTILEWLGLRFSGLLPAVVFPLLLTMVLFLGPLSLHYVDGVFRLYLEKRYWADGLRNLTWLRNHIVAPLSEEFIFRACMIPLLVHPYGTGKSVILVPLFFGVAHVHHMVEKLTHGKEPIQIVIGQTVFQMLYTTVFGAYSAFLFMRTGHLMSAVMAHAFCNHMGFPAFSEVNSYPQPMRQKLIMAFIGGLLLFLVMLYPLTTPALYANNVYDL